MATLALNQLQLAPLGAGDLIDRTVRLYRRHFMALIRASAPPVAVSAVGTVLYTVMIRAIGSTASSGKLAVYVLLSVLGLALALVGFLLQLVVMGGASRNLVMHLLSDEPVTTRLIYRNVRARFWKLLGATILVVIWGIISASIATMVMILAVFLILLVAAFTAPLGLPWVTGVIGLFVYLAMIILALAVFFLIAGRAAYVPQVLMVEGRGVFESISRSAQLARGNVRRLMAMFLFSSFATYSALMLLLIPLGWIAYLYGVNPFDFYSGRTPVWYEIGATVVRQVSVILLAPVWTLGLSLLYVDERVRHEGYDIELLAAQRFGEIPTLPYGTLTPLSPAIAPAATRAPVAASMHGATSERGKNPASVLGLFDR